MKKSEQDKELLNAMIRDPKNWKGPIYFNKNDHRLIVPKINQSFGWQFNFANPYSYITLILIIMTIIFITILFSKINK